MQRKKMQAKASYIGIAAAFIVIGIVGVIIWAVNFSPNLTVYKVGNYEIKKDLYSCVYYYDTMASQDWSGYGFEVTKDPYEQDFDYMAKSEDFDSWGDYFQSLTDDTLRFMYVMKDIAEKNSYSYSDEVNTHINAELSGIETEKGTAMSFKEYMLRNYGAEISKKTFTEYLTLHYQATEFYEKISEDKALFEKYIGYNQEDIENAYQADKDKFDVVSFRFYYLNDNKYNAEKIAALKSAKNEKEFKDLCNEYENDESYTEKDGSLFENYSLYTVNSMTKSVLAKKLSSSKSKAGDIYFGEGEADGKKTAEILYVVKSRAKNENAYNDTQIKMWEHQAMGALLEEYYDSNYKSEEVPKGIEVFKESMIIPSAE